MSKKPKAEFAIDKVESLPKSVREKVKAYDTILEDIGKKEQGTYKISMPSKKVMSLYVGLLKRIKTDNLQNQFKIHLINKEVFIEKLK